MTRERGPKFFQTSEFKKLSQKWAATLKKKGFEDIEKPCGNLKSHNLRTQSYILEQDLQQLTLISSALGFYVEHAKGLKGFERQILWMHSQGVYKKEIMRKTRKSHQTVWKTIKKHLPLALGLYREEEESEEPD